MRIEKNNLIYLNAGILKRIVTVAMLIILSACANNKVEIPKVPEFNVHAMTRSEVVSAINECEGAGMKSFVEYLSQKTEYGKVLVPVNVHCNPAKKNWIAMNDANVFWVIIILCLILGGCPKKQTDFQIVNNTQEIYTTINTNEEFIFPLPNIINSKKEIITNKLIEEFSIEKYIDDCILLTNNTQICKEIGFDIVNWIYQPNKNL